MRLRSSVWRVIRKIRDENLSDECYRAEDGHRRCRVGVRVTCSAVGKLLAVVELGCCGSFAMGSLPNPYAWCHRQAGAQRSPSQRARNDHSSASPDPGAPCAPDLGRYNRVRRRWRWIRTPGIKRTRERRPVCWIAHAIKRDVRRCIPTEPPPIPDIRTMRRLAVERV